MKKNSKIYIAGHTGLVGSAIKKKLIEKKYSKLIFSDIEDFDLRRQSEVEKFFDKERPEYVFLAAAKVGGILANKTYPAEFIFDNLSIELNVVHAAYKYGVKKLLFLGSSCIYPKFAPQPMKEEHLLTSPLEPTNEAYAIAKIAGLKLCRYYNEQYGTDFICVMPTNLYGPNDNYDLETSHVFPAMIRKFFLAKCLYEGNFKGIRENLARNQINDISVDKLSDQNIRDLLSKYGIKSKSNTQSSTYLTLWGTGSPKRECLYVDDLADAVIFLMENCDYKEIGEIINIGTGSDISIKELAELVKKIAGFKGEIHWDESKPDGTPQKLLDVTRLHNLGWKHKTNLQEGIEKTYKWYLENKV